MASGDADNAAKDIASRGEAAAEGVPSTLGAAAATAGETARDLAARTKDAAADLYAQTKDQVRNAAGRLPDSASDAMAASQVMYNKSSDAVGRQIAKQPIEALLLAGAIGYLVGWAANRS